MFLYAKTWYNRTKNAPSILSPTKYLRKCFYDLRKNKTARNHFSTSIWCYVIKRAEKIRKTFFFFLLDKILVLPRLIYSFMICR